MLPFYHIILYLYIKKKFVLLVLFDGVRVFVLAVWASSSFSVWCVLTSVLIQTAILFYVRRGCVLCVDLQIGDLYRNDPRDLQLSTEFWPITGSPRQRGITVISSRYILYYNEAK